MLLREYFVTEATELLQVMGRAGTQETDPATLAELGRCARGLRGLARLANEIRVAEAAAAVEQAARSIAAPEAAAGLADRVQASVADLRVLVEGGADDSVLDACRAAVVDRWSGVDDATDEPSTAVPEPTPEPDFHAFVAREVSGIADVLDRGIAAFTEVPTNREWLGAILRRQRALMGVARLAEVGTVAETLRAVEDMSELIVRLNVPIKSEWLDVFRSAREILRTSMTSLLQNEMPPFTPALSRLRTLRDELRDRYGEKAAAAAADRPRSEPAAASPAAPAEPAVSRHERAARLRAEIDRAIGGDARARDALHELHTLLIEAWK
jgi:chemotaxis protein histidine kinase CheA